MVKIILILFVSGFSLIGHCQSSESSTVSSSDSTRFKLIQQELIGCWESKHYQFKYQINLGTEFKSRIHSSAPIFKLILKNEEVYIEWIELTGGESLQKVISITKNKLTIENENQLTFVYKRNKNCSSQVRSRKG